MNKSDELRSKLPSLAAEMHFSIGDALQKIRHATRVANHISGDVGLAWKKGLTDALLLLRSVQESHDRFSRWMADVVAQEPDSCGLTREEREALLGKETPSVIVTNFMKDQG